MAHESQETDDKMWLPYVEHIFIEIMLEEQLKGNIENGVFKGLMCQTITTELNTRTGKSFPSKKVLQKHNRLRLKKCKWSQLLKHIGLGWDESTQTVTGPDEVSTHVNHQVANLRIQECLDYDKLQQLFAPSIATRNLQISSNTPALNSDEEPTLEEELANESVPTHLDDDCYTPSQLESIPQIVEDIEFEDQTQNAGKRPMQDASAKSKKVSKKVSRINDMTVASKEYTTMTKDGFSGKRGKSSCTFEQFCSISS